VIGELGKPKKNDGWQTRDYGCEQDEREELK
jgi:hypothetical protein